MISKNQIKQLNALHLKKYREEQKLFIAEGKKIIDELIRYKPGIVRELFATADFINEKKEDLKNAGLKFTEVTNEELGRISTQSTPNAVLAVCHYLEEENKTYDLRTQFSLYLDDIRDPGNLGTILRLADWFGMKQVFCSPGSTELYNPKTIQSAMGAFLRVGVKYMDLKTLVEKASVPVYGAVLDGKNIYKEKLEHGIIIIGNEANGIRPDNLSLVTHPVTIPASSSNKTESLNAAVAASIISAEFFRQLKT